MTGHRAFRQRFTQPILMLVTEPMPGIERVVAEAVRGGVDIVQWRDHASEPDDLFAQADTIRAAVASPALLIVNGNVKLAAACRADGIHLGEQGPPIAEVRAAVGNDMIISRSVHSVNAAMAAAAEGADYLIAGTIFASRSHPGREPAGLDFLRQTCEAVDIPVIAIGGITVANAGVCIKAGAAGIAVLSPIMHAAYPTTLAMDYRMALDRPGATPIALDGRAPK